MKHQIVVMALSLFCNFVITAQPSIKISNNFIATREQYNISSVAEDGRCILRESHENSQYKNKGKFMLCDTSFKKLATTNYELKWNQLETVAEPLLNKDKLMIITASMVTNFRGSSFNLPENTYNDFEPYPYVFCWNTKPYTDMVKQDYDTKTLAKIGAPFTIPIPKEKTYYVKGIRSLDGNYYAILGCKENDYKKCTYWLYNSKGLVFTKEIEITGSGSGKRNIDLPSLIMANNGDLAFLYTESGSEKISTTQLGFLSATKQQLVTKKLTVTGKLVSHFGIISFTKDGGLVAAVNYGKTESGKYNSTGVLFQKYSADMQLENQGIIDYSAQTLQTCSSSWNGGVAGSLYMQKPRAIHQFEDGSFAFISEQEYPKPTHISTVDLVIYNNTFCMRLNSKLENTHQYVIAQHDDKIEASNFTPCNFYFKENEILIFHTGTSESDKKPADYCTWWEKDTGSPARMKLNTLITFGDMREIQKNKLLFLNIATGGYNQTIIDIE